MNLHVRSMVNRSAHAVGLRQALWLLCAAIALPCGAAAALRQKVDVFGYYSIDGRVPAAFAGIDHLHLSTIRIGKGKVVNAPLWGLIRLKARGRAKPADLQLVKPTLQGKQLRFTTTAPGGTSYRFNGAFTKLGDFPSNPPNGEVVLKGRLEKLRAGKVIAASDVGFSYFGGD